MSCLLELHLQFEEDLDPKLTAKVQNDVFSLIYIPWICSIDVLSLPSSHSILCLQLHDGSSFIFRSVESTSREACSYAMDNLTTFDWQAFWRAQRKWRVIVSHQDIQEIVTEVKNRLEEFDVPYSVSR